MDPNQQQSPEQPAPQEQPFASPQPAAPQVPTNYGASQPPTYDPHYLDSIAPPPPRPKFFSGSFGKIFFIMIAVFVLAVSLIIAFSGKDKTADLQQITVRLGNMQLVAKKYQTYLKSNNLSSANSIFQLWITDNQKKAQDLLTQAGVKKTQYDKKMVASEKDMSDKLGSKFEDARLNATLDRVYASTMAAETDKLITLYNIMGKNSKAKAIRDYAKSASTNLKTIQQSFAGYVDDGN